MKKLILVFSVFCVFNVAQSTFAQPAKSRLTNGTNKPAVSAPATGTPTVATTKDDAPTTATPKKDSTPAVASRTARKAAAAKEEPKTVDRASIMFPTAVEVPEDVSWRRDIYRSLDLTKDENAPLYFPVQPQGDKVNLFTLLFQLLNQGKIPAYEYKLDGLEDFSKANRMHFKDMLDRQGIFYEIQGNTIQVNASDVPSEEVTAFFIKESTYYDQNTATFHSRVTAICPVLQRADDFGFEDDLGGMDEGAGDDAGEEAMDAAPVQKKNNPLFWVKMDDITPYLSQHMIMTSNYNNAAQCSMADFFDTNKYKGTIYMTTNMQNRMLQQDFANEKALKKEQDRIEQQLTDFEKHLWETPVDSAAIAKRDSLAALQKGSKKVKTTKTSATKTEKTTKVKTEKASKSSGSSSGGARVSARRQRH